MHVPFVWEGETSLFKGAVHKSREVSGAAEIPGVFPGCIIIGKCQSLKQYLVVVKNVTKPRRLVLNPDKSL